MTHKHAEMVAEAASYIKERAGAHGPFVKSAVLGSGLADALSIEPAMVIDYGDIPHFPVPTVAGHGGKLFVFPGLLVLSGRVHGYEGHDPGLLPLPLAATIVAGAKEVLLTNAAGSINLDFHPGDLVLLSDHINFMGKNPLVGPHVELFGPRFPDMSEVYKRDLRAQFSAWHREQFGSLLKEGVYLAVSGPNYETPAEIQAFRRWGADLVGMSTVPEAMVANAMGARCVAISMVTNYGSGISDQQLSHQEVVEQGRETAPRLGQLISTWAAIGS